MGCTVAQKPIYAEIQRFSTLTMLKSVAKLGRKTRSSTLWIFSLRKDSLSCLHTLLFKDSGDLSKVIVQVDACETLFKKPGMKYVRKWEDINVNGVQMT